MKKFNVCAITSTRAEYGLLRSLLLKLEQEESIELNIIVTGTHLLEEFGYTKKEVLTDSYSNVTDIYFSMDDDSKSGMAISCGKAMIQFAQYFKNNYPDLLIVLGDRFEIFGAISVAHIMGITIAHISGGDVTEGAIDDALRHSMTKLSYLHFPGCEQSAKRIIQMGEEPSRVFNVGEPGIENCLNLNLLSCEELACQIGFDNVQSDFSVVTFHPVTMEESTAEKQVNELIAAMDSFSYMSYIITLANADAGGKAINEIWTREGKKRSNWFVTPSLGMIRYLSAMKNAKLVIGNSSSGIVEAPSMGTPTINIGDRQKGRMMAKSIIGCRPNKNDIVNAMKKGLSKEMQHVALHVVSPFGNGTTSSRMLSIIMEFLNNKNSTNEKHFFDIDFKI